MPITCIIPIHKPISSELSSNLIPLFDSPLIAQVRLCASISTDVLFLDHVYSPKLLLIKYFSYGQVHQRAFAYSYAPIRSKYTLNLDQDIFLSVSAIKALYDALESNLDFISASLPCISKLKESFPSSLQAYDKGLIHKSGYCQSPLLGSGFAYSTWTKGGCTLWRSTASTKLFSSSQLPRCTWSPCEDLIFSFTDHHCYSHLLLFTHYAIHANARLSLQTFSLRLIWKGLNIALWRYLFVLKNPISLSFPRYFFGTLLRAFQVNYPSKLCVSSGYYIALLFVVVISPFSHSVKLRLTSEFIFYCDQIFNKL